MASTERAVGEQVSGGDVAATWEPMSGLVPWEGNPRVNAGAVAKLAAGIIRWGFGAPLIARLANRELSAGHTRFKAAKRLRGLHSAAEAAGDLGSWSPDAIRVATQREVPVRFMDLTEQESHEYALADNKLGELSEWDPSALLSAMQTMDVDTILQAGWDQDGLQKLIGEMTLEEKQEQLAGDDTDKVQTTFQVLITCTDERSQRELIDLCQSEGWVFRALV